MTGDFGPPQQGPEPESLTPETGTPKTGTSDPENPESAKKEKSGRLAKLRGRTPLTVAAAIVAVGAIAATSWGLARHGGGEEATPAPDNGGVTFGPNQPSEISSTGLPTFPTFPTTLPTVPTELPTATFPTFPTIPTATYPAPSTFPTYPITYPTSYPTTTLPTSPTTTTSAPGNQVYPVSPIAKPITKCGTHGSVRVVKTEGVKYALVVGDGRKGRWVVSAEPRPRYQLGPGATTRFHGNLGRFYRCPVVLGIRKVVTAHTGELATDPWLVRVKPSVPEKEKRDLSVTYSFATDVEVVAYGGAGWTCVGSEVSGAAVTCSFAGQGTPPAVSLTVRATDDDGANVPPSGTATLSADDEAVDAKTFDAGAA